MHIKFFVLTVFIGIAIAGPLSSPANNVGLPIANYPNQRTSTPNLVNNEEINFRLPPLDDLPSFGRRNRGALGGTNFPVADIGYVWPHQRESGMVNNYDESENPDRNDKMFGDISSSSWFARPGRGRINPEAFYRDSEISERWFSDMSGSMRPYGHGRAGSQLGDTSANYHSDRSGGSIPIPYGRYGEDKSLESRMMGDISTKISPMKPRLYRRNAEFFTVPPPISSSDDQQMEDESFPQIARRGDYGFLGDISGSVKSPLNAQESQGLYGNYPSIDFRNEEDENDQFVNFPINNGENF